MQYKTMRESPHRYARGARLSRLDLDDSTSSPSANEFALFPLSKALPGGRPHIGLSMQLRPYKYTRMAVCDTPPYAKAYQLQTFMMRSRISKKGFESKGFVKKSARLSAEVTKGTTSWPDSTTSLT